MIAHLDGHLLLPRLIRYIEERRRSEARFTGAIERHPSPLARGVGPGRPHRRAGHDRPPPLRPGRTSGVEVLDGVGHYPMVEAPSRFLDAVLGDRREPGG